jgi:hypothetical protein
MHIIILFNFPFLSMLCYSILYCVFVTGDYPHIYMTLYVITMTKILNRNYSLSLTTITFPFIHGWNRS